MAVESKYRILAGLSADDASEDAAIAVYLEQAQEKVVCADYPYGYDDAKKAASLVRYKSVVDSLFSYLYNKQGAEGESAHNENGTNRSYVSESDYLQSITPHVGTF